MKRKTVISLLALCTFMGMCFPAFGANEVGYGLFLESGIEAATGGTRIEVTYACDGKDFFMTLRPERDPVWCEDRVDVKVNRYSAGSDVPETLSLTADDSLSSDCGKGNAVLYTVKSCGPRCATLVPSPTCKQCDYKNGPCDPMRPN